MRNVLLFTFGAFCGSLVTYIIMRKEREDYDWEPEPVVVERTNEPETEPKETERTQYEGIVDDLYTPQFSSRSDAPYLISEEEYSTTCLDYDKCELIYYEGDGTLTNEDFVVEDLDYTIGIDNLRYFGTNELEDPDVMYIRNEHNGVDYLITAKSVSYVDTLPPDEVDAGDE